MTEALSRSYSLRELVYKISGPLVWGCSDGSVVRAPPPPPPSPPMWPGFDSQTWRHLTNRKWFSVVCTLIDNDIRHHSGQNVVDSRGEPLSICFLTQNSTPKKVFISERDQNHYRKKEQALSITFLAIWLAYFPK